MIREVCEMGQTVDEQKARAELERGYEGAQKILNDEDRLERLLQKLEKKLKIIPVAGDTLANLPAMISLIRSYVKKEYQDVPLGTIIAVVSAIAYVVSPVDIIPDFIPGAGYLDDVAVITVCLKLVGSDVDDYRKWRKENDRNFDI
jgi:uncharacterized membrane protein YkvA (DUF1232 family)